MECFNDSSRGCRECAHLKQNLEINKQVMQNLIQQNQQLESTYQGEIIILKKIISDHQKLHTEEVDDLTDQLTHAKDALEMKEYLLQEKENKWKEFEDIVVKFAEDHEDLQEALAKIDYLCDEVTSNRKITNVVKENSDLKSTVSHLKNKLSEAMSANTWMDVEDRINLNAASDDEPGTTKNKNHNMLNLENQNFDTQYQTVDLSCPTKRWGSTFNPKFRRSRFGSCKLSFDDDSSSTEKDSFEENGVDSKLPKEAESESPIGDAPMKFETQNIEELEHINESTINMDENMSQGFTPKGIYEEGDGFLDGAIDLISQKYQTIARKQSRNGV